MFGSTTLAIAPACAIAAAMALGSICAPFGPVWPRALAMPLANSCIASACCSAAICSGVFCGWHADASTAMAMRLIVRIMSVSPSEAAI